MGAAPVASGSGPGRSPARLGVNASIVGTEPTGLGIYTIHLVRAIGRLRPGLVAYTSAPAALAAPGVSTRPVARHVRPERGTLGHAARLVWLQVGLRPRLLRDRIDLLLNTVPEGPIRPRVPQVTVVHDLLPLRYPAQYPRQQHYFRHLVPRVLRASRLVIADSESTRRDVLETYGIPAERVRVVPAGYDAETFRPGAGGETASGPPYVLFVGNLLPHKNVLGLIEAFAAVPSGIPCRLVIRGAGRRANERQVRERIAALGLGPRVELRAYASGAELARLYRGAGAVVVPSLYEGFGLTALEAMASGAPVVASRTSSLPEIVADAALLVDPTDTRALADAMTALLARPELGGDLRRRGLARAGCFSWERTARGVLEVLDEAARR
jgi:glycosyltransferase involved in cell wall biosynthesis